MTLTTRLFVIIMMAVTSAHAQQNPHARHMERAHPTPVGAEKLQEMTLKLPFVQDPSPLSSMFLNGNMIVETEQGLPAQNESSIAINPLDPSNLIGAAVDYRNNSSRWVYYTTDAGRTWQNKDLGQVRTGWSSSNDPSVCYDHLGRGYLCYGGFNRVGNTQFGENGIFVSYTDDGGRTWPTTHVPVIMHTGQQTADSSFEDKYYIHADTATGSPYRGRLYIPWKRVVNRDSSTQIVIVHSTDRGRSWSAPRNVSDRFPGTSEDTTFGQSFPLARTGPDGTVHLVWNSGTERAIRYAQSTDGGVTWSQPRILHRYQSFGKKSLIAGQVNSRVKEVVRAEAFPTLVVDNTNGPRRGNLYLVWSADTVPNIYFSVSTNNGGTWSQPRIVHSDTSNDQFWPWIALDPTNGDLAVMYFDSRDDDANLLVNCYVSYSSDGGATWTDRRAADQASDLRRNPFTGNTFAGDYSGCDFYDGMVYPSWVDMRNTALNIADNDVYTAAVNVRAPEATSTFAARTIADVPTSIDLSWSAVTALSFGQPLDPSTNYILRRDGAEIARPNITDTTYRDTGLTTYQRYTYTIAAATPTDTSAWRTASAFAGGSRQPGIPTLHAVRGNENGIIEAFVELPRRRLDATTPLLNLDGVKFTANAWTRSESVVRTDTGEIRTFFLQPNASGWYRVSVQAVDASGNLSPSSDTLVCYTGTLTWTQETFDSLPNFRVIRGLWGRTTSFAFSEPASYTETPAGNYGALRNDTVLLYPHRIASEPGKERVVLTMRVAAFVDPSDTAFVEYAYDARGPWEQGARFNAGSYARWADTTKGDDAWRFEQIFINSRPADTLFLRLRFRSNTGRHSDGIYIDDITFEEGSSVDDALDPVIGMHPMPASSSLVIGLHDDVAPSAIIVTSMDGQRTSVPWSMQGRTIVLDVRDLTSGSYVVMIQRAQGTITRAFQVYR